jgi:hypothetical protein
MKTTLMSQTAERPRHRPGWTAPATLGAKSTGLLLLLNAGDAVGALPKMPSGSAGRGGSND